MLTNIVMYDKIFLRIFKKICVQSIDMFNN